MFLGELGVRLVEAPEVFGYQRFFVHSFGDQLFFMWVFIIDSFIKWLEIAYIWLLNHPPSPHYIYNFYSQRKHMDSEFFKSDGIYNLHGYFMAFLNRESFI